jgi:hypothetical protein
MPRRASMLVPLTWDLLLLLPNVRVPTPTPFNGGMVRICAGDDAVFQQLRRNPGNVTATRMMQRFSDQFGNRYQPSCLLVANGTPDRVRHADALRAFRNCCALATILSARRGTQWQPSYSDHFDIYPLAAGKDGWIVANDAVVRGMWQSSDFVSGQSSALIQNPTSFSCRPSRRLLCRLVEAWGRCYVTMSRPRRPLLRLFRSIEVALHASRFPTDSLLSVYDAGLRLVVWVSAFEVLLHPGGQKIGLPTVLNLIRSLPWRDRTLTYKRYRASYYNVPSRVSLPEAIYYDLYMARNDFGHGNDVPRRAIWFRRDTALGHLSSAVPNLYRAVLEQQLDLLLPDRTAKAPESGALRWFRTNAGRRYVHDRARYWGDRQGLESALLSTARRRSSP